MAGPRDYILQALTEIESGIDQSSFFVKKKLGRLGPLAILPYHGFGNHQSIFIKGRLLEDEGLERPGEDASVWKNMVTMYHRYNSFEIPNARIEASFRGQKQEIVTDEEGYFEVTFSAKPEELSDQTWHSVEFKLLDQVTEEQPEVTATGEVMVPGNDARFGVISDVDDTILVSRSTDMIQKAKLTFLHNAKTRMPFEGVSSFYQALQQGTETGEFNPIFYVSSSPWNLYDLLEKFCEVNDIPKGPFLLRDIGISRDKFIKTGHIGYKVKQVESIFKMYPDLSFILIGDSGQKDAEIYQQVVDDYPDKILAIYIRDVTPDRNSERDRVVKEIAESIQSKGIDMLLCQTTEEAAQHAVDQGYIPASALEKVKRGRQEDHEREPE